MTKITQERVDKAEIAVKAVRSAAENLNKAIKDAAEIGVSATVEIDEFTTFKTPFVQLRVGLGLHLGTV